jgi:RNA polymerase sigma-70 factor (ECF subfamily)
MAAGATTEELWKDFGGRLRRYIGRHLRNRDDVDDVLQEVFARIHVALPQVKDAPKLEPWLFQVTRRAVIDRSRRNWTRLATASEPAEVAELPATTSAAAELAACLKPLMGELAAEDREALRLTDVEGLPQKELAARLGLSLTGAKSRVQRARQRLRALLLRCCDVEHDRRGNPVAHACRRPIADCSCS